MRITDIRILGSAAAALSGCPEAEIELDGVLTLRGIRIRRNRFGYFLAFPGHGARSFVDLLQPAFAKSLRQSVLDAFQTWRQSFPGPMVSEGGGAIYAGGAA